MKINKIIVQAGGQGSRLGKYTKNKPKALLSVQGMPILFHIFEKYQDSEFIIIVDYKKDIMIEYLKCFAKVKYKIIQASKKGTCAGIGEALKLVENNEQLAILWCDLFPLKELDFSSLSPANYMGISGDFTCRWSYINNKLIEAKSTKDGVAGVYIFTDKDLLNDVPCEGEFVKYLASKEEQLKFKRLELNGCFKELGLIEEYEKFNGEYRVRSFNEITFTEDKVIKRPRNQKGKEIAEHEANWYKNLSETFTAYPKIFSYEPLTLERINGINPFDIQSDKDKENSISLIMNTLSSLHRSCKKETSNRESINEVYYIKTVNRVEKVKNLIPLIHQKTICINNIECKNYFHSDYFKELKAICDAIECKEFSYIHGDSTFSNMLISQKEEKIYLIDPRGYFGNELLYGDPKYDYAKLYYSIKGNYDKFNMKRFELTIEERKVEITVESSGWEKYEEKFFEMLPADINPKDIKIIHGLIWLSLTSYAWDDYDSICGAYYLGLYYLNIAMED